MGVNTQTRFDTTLNGGITDIATSLTLDAAPAFTTGYGTLERGTANEEDVYWGGLSGLQLTSVLRGLSKTALTNTEVAGNKLPHADGAQFEGTLLHYIVNDKASKSSDEAITGAWNFNVSLPTSTQTPSGGTDLTTKTYVDAADALKANLAGGNTWTGAQDFSGATAVFADDGAETATNAAPTSDKKLANKKYVDDSVSSGLASNSVDSHDIYTPAYLTGGGAGTSNYTLWVGTTDGEFAITIDGVAHDITAINFGSVTSMVDVAAAIQARVRAVTSGSETVVWNGSAFVITSGNTTSASAITVLSAVSGGSGTDISGVAAGPPTMDADSGNGTVTNAVVDETADAGKIVKLDATTGDINDDLLTSNVQLKDTLTTKGDLYAATASGVTSRRSVGSNGQVLAANSSEATGMEWVDRVQHTFGVTSFAPTTTGDDVTIAHGLGTTPNFFKISYMNANQPDKVSGVGVYDGSSYALLYELDDQSGGSPGNGALTSTSKMIISDAESTANGQWTATVTTFNSTNVIIECDTYGSGVSASNRDTKILWEAWA